MSADPTVIPIIPKWEPKKVTAKSTTPSRPEPLKTLLASARRMTSADSDSRGQSRVGQTADWQSDAWDLFDLVDRKSTRLNSSHVAISYAVFCLKKKK